MHGGGSIHALSVAVTAFTLAFALAALPIAVSFTAACGGHQALTDAESTGTAPVVVSDAPPAGPASREPEATDPDASGYRGPSVGPAKGFAALAYSAIATLESSPVTGNLGVSGASVRSIAGFEAVPVLKYGIDSSPPHSLRTILTQRGVDALVDDIDVRACDANFADVAADARGGITLHPGVTCLNGSGVARPLRGSITLDAGGDANAFFIIRGDFELTVADDTVLLLANGAQACSVFWRLNQQVTIGARAALVGTVIAETGITMHSGSTLVGRALARTGAVALDGNTITIPIYGAVGDALTCAHLQ